MRKEIKFLKEYEPYEAGEVRRIDAALADYLVEIGTAELVEVKAEKTEPQPKKGKKE